MIVGFLYLDAQAVRAVKDTKDRSVSPGLHPRHAGSIPTVTTIKKAPHPHPRQMSSGGREGGKISLKESQIKDVIMLKKKVF